MADVVSDAMDSNRPQSEKNLVASNTVARLNESESLRGAGGRIDLPDELEELNKLSSNREDRVRER